MDIAIYQQTNISVNSLRKLTSCITAVAEEMVVTSAFKRQKQRSREAVKESPLMQAAVFQYSFFFFFFKYTKMEKSQEIQMLF